MNRITEILEAHEYIVTSGPHGGGYRGSVIPTARKYTDPIVLFQCPHQHRRRVTAENCASAWVEDVKRYGLREASRRHRRVARK